MSDDINGPNAQPERDAIADCEMALEPHFQRLWETARNAGWTDETIYAALTALIDNQMLILQALKKDSKRDDRKS